ncbi:YdgA family protein [Parasalinivibrio latis]|uniref:DUF945 family protein n=1 Tax=Parasalinivibrio latis TaxID=2952610 RepID=UPI0030E05419
MLFGKKAAIAGAVSMAVFWPMASGQFGQNAFDNALAELKTSPYVKIEESTYQRGYLSSQAENRLLITGEPGELLKQMNIPVEYVMDSRISHGLFSISTSTTIKPVGEKTKKAIWKPSDTPASINSETTVSGRTSFTMNMAAISAELENADIVTSSLVVEGVVNRDGVAALTYRMPSIAVTEPAGGTLKVERLSGKANGKMEGNFWIGEQSGKAGAIKITSSEGESVTLDRPALVASNRLVSLAEQSESENSPEFLNSDTTFTLNKVSVDGAGDILKNYKALLQFKNLNAAALSELAAMSETLDEAPSESEVLKVQNALNRLVESGMDIVFNQSGVLEEGAAKADISFNVAEGTENVSENIFALFNGLTGAINIEMPQATAVAFFTPTGYEQLQSMGLVQERDQNAVIQAKVDGADLVLENGERLPLTTLFLALFA